MEPYLTIWRLNHFFCFIILSNKAKPIITVLIFFIDWKYINILFVKEICFILCLLFLLSFIFLPIKLSLKKLDVSIALTLWDLIFVVLLFLYFKIYFTQLIFGPVCPLTLLILAKEIVFWIIIIFFLVGEAASIFLRVNLFRTYSFILDS